MAIIAIIHCDYDEGDASTYRGMTVKIDGEEIRFFSEDPDGDYDDACFYAGEATEFLFTSSDVDNFWLDKEEGRVEVSQHEGP